MNDHKDLKHLSEEHCWELLNKHSTGRLAMNIGNEVDVYPVHYAVADQKIYFLTFNVEKFSSVMVSRLVSFEIDETEKGVTRWVVLRGTAHWLSDKDDAHHAEALGLTVNLPTLESHWVEIEPSKVIGREMTFTVSQ